MNTEQKLKGKCALVTGGAKRLGREIALALADSGADVVVHYRASRTEAQEVCLRCRERGVRAEMLAANLSDATQAEQLVGRAASLLRQPDILVNNASIFPSDTLASMTEKSLLDNIGINAFSPLVIARAFALGVRDGVVINLLDTRITENDRAHASYHLSKRMLASLTRMLAREFAPGIRVNAVAPGLVLPPEGKDALYFHDRIRAVPLGRHGDAGDVTDAVLYLAGAGFVTGQIIFVDGGARMKGDTYGW